MSAFGSQFGDLHMTGWIADAPTGTEEAFLLSVRWTSVFDGLPEPRRAVLRNEHLWTDADRAVWDDTPA